VLVLGAGADFALHWMVENASKVHAGKFFSRKNQGAYVYVCRGLFEAAHACGCITVRTVSVHRGNICNMHSMSVLTTNVHIYTYTHVLQSQFKRDEHYQETAPKRRDSGSAVSPASTRASRASLSPEETNARLLSKVQYLNNLINVNCQEQGPHRPERFRPPIIHRKSSIRRTNSDTPTSLSIDPGNSFLSESDPCLYSDACYKTTSNDRGRRNNSKSQSSSGWGREVVQQPSIDKVHKWMASCNGPDAERAAMAGTRRSSPGNRRDGTHLVRTCSPST
jgi:hypothetical protein